MPAPALVRLRVPTWVMFPTMVRTLALLVRVTVVLPFISTGELMIWVPLETDTLGVFAPLSKRRMSAFPTAPIE